MGNLSLWSFLLLTFQPLVSTPALMEDFLILQLLADEIYTFSSLSIADWGQGFSKSSALVIHL